MLHEFVATNRDAIIARTRVNGPPPGSVDGCPDRARLVIGPFRGSSDAEIFQEDLQSVGIDAFSWTNSDSDRIVPLGTE